MNDCGFLFLIMVEKANCLMIEDNKVFDKDNNEEKR